VITARTRVFALLGRPIRHSPSPVLHNRWFADHDVDAVYVALEPPGDVDLRSALAPLAGANLTTPFKRAVLPALARSDAEVDLTGAANTVLVAEDGALQGYNTDVAGLDRALGPIAPGPGVVLGAGGAARAAVRVLQLRGCSRISVLNRTPGRATELAVPPEGAGGLDAASWRAAAAGATVAINATTAGARELIQALDPGLLAPDATWCDLNYWDADPPGFAKYRATGRRTVDGWEMLLHQAALSFELFTGIRLSPSEIAVARASVVPPAPARW
jgi:shikimate dehydrogenase